MSDDYAKKLIAALQSMRDRLMGELPGRFGDAFDGDFDTLLDTINHLKRQQRLPHPVAQVIFTNRKKPDVEWLVDSVRRGTLLYTEPPK